jgi:hypothetical protein
MRGDGTTGMLVVCFVLLAVILGFMLCMALGIVR